LDKVQKIILVSIISVSAIAWIFSLVQPDMMEAMMTLNPIATLIFILSWTIGMAAMMFPAIIPMILLYNKLISKSLDDNHNNHKSDYDTSSVLGNFKPKSDTFKPQENGRFSFMSLPFGTPIKIAAFIGTYLLVWTLTGIFLLVVWSIVMNSLVVTYSSRDIEIVAGIILLISGIYQFISLKRKCLGYCESPLAFFMKRWKGNKLRSGLTMGFYHGLYCLGCCWPYFLLMIALGWMNIFWMGMFAGIIFVEKIWSKGIYVSKATGIFFMIISILVLIGTVSIMPEDEKMNSLYEMESMNMSNSNPDKRNDVIDNTMNMNMKISK
jgi:predicted metal-binding membrane protein